MFLTWHHTIITSAVNGIALFRPTLRQTILRKNLISQRERTRDLHRTINGWKNKERLHCREHTESHSRVRNSDWNISQVDAVPVAGPRAADMSGCSDIIVNK